MIRSSMSRLQDAIWGAGAEEGENEEAVLDAAVGGSSSDTSSSSGSGTKGGGGEFGWGGASGNY